MTLPADTPPSQLVLPALGLLFWFLVYVLMWRRGAKDRTYGMPVAALCVNVAWETIFTFCFDTPTVFKVGNGLWLLVDLGVLYTCFKYGPADFASPLARRWLRPALPVILLAAGAVELGFIHAFKDFYGGFSATFTTMLLSAQLIAMILRRNSVQGQSLYIALCVLAGNVAGYFMNRMAQQTVAPDLSVLWIQVSNAFIVACNFVYIGLYLHVAKRDGVDPWRRL